MRFVCAWMSGCVFVGLTCFFVGVCVCWVVLDKLLL